MVWITETISLQFIYFYYLFPFRQILSLIYSCLLCRITCQHPTCSQTVIRCIPERIAQVPVQRSTNTTRCLHLYSILWMFFSFDYDSTQCPYCIMSGCSLLTTMHLPYFHSLTIFLIYLFVQVLNQWASFIFHSSQSIFRSSICFWSIQPNYFVKHSSELLFIWFQL